MFGLIYGFLFVCWIFALRKVIQSGPSETNQPLISKSFFRHEEHAHV